MKHLPHICVLAALVVLWPETAVAQWIRVSTSAASDSLKGTPVMISIIQDGAIVKQFEEWINAAESFQVEPGIYDVRLEGEGLVTLVKRGVTASEGHTVNVIGGPLRAGEGVQVVEYATGGFTREELAERLMRLEAGLARVEEVLQSTTQALEQLELRSGG